MKLSLKSSKLLGLALLSITLGTAGCESITTPGDEFIEELPNDTISSITSISIRPSRIEMEGVHGFAIVDNTSNAPRTKLDTNGDGIDDIKISPYTLYTIDENGELHLSIFYFEVVSSNNDSTDVSQTVVMKEVSNALQIVPSLVTDLGKYILFSGCQYQIADSRISNEAAAICKAYIRENWRNYMTYMIRKSDGGLFDFSEQPLCYYYGYHGNELIKYSSYPDPEIEDANGVHISEDTYMVSAKENLFMLSSSPEFIAKFEDNGNTIDLKKMTQNYGVENTNYIEKFIVDKDENIYVFYPASGVYNATLHLYYAGGGFNAQEFPQRELFDLTTDESGDAYIFLTLYSCKVIEKQQEDGSTYHIEEYGNFIVSAYLNNGAIEVKESFLPSNTEIWKGSIYHRGYNNNSINWCLRYTEDLCMILSYDTNTHTYTLEQVPAEINQILVADYDIIIKGDKTYCANIEGNNIMVTEIDLASKTYRTYSLIVDMPNVVTPTYRTLITQGVPYLIINGRNTTNGAKVSITINLLNGETNSKFASDSRNVVSFYRIN